MENSREEIIEALEVACEYIPKLRNGIQNVCRELNGVRQPDTDEFLNSIIQGINWVIQVYNPTREVIAESGSKIDKDKVNQSILSLNDALMQKSDLNVARVLGEEVAPFLQSFEDAARVVIGAN